MEVKTKELWYTLTDTLDVQCAYSREFSLGRGVGIKGRSKDMLNKN